MSEGIDTIRIDTIVRRKKCKKVYQYCENTGVLTKSFKSVTHASRITRINYGKIAD